MNFINKTCIIQLSHYDVMCPSYILDDESEYILKNGEITVKKEAAYV